MAARRATIEKGPGDFYAVYAPYLVGTAIREIPGARWAPGIRGHLVPPDAAGAVKARIEESGEFQARVPANGSWPPTPRSTSAVPFRAPLRPYQEEAARFLLAQQGGVLGLPMAAGKSIVALEVARALGGPTLVLAPGVARSVWTGTQSEAGEVRKWWPEADLRVCQSRTPDPETLKGLGPSSVVVAHYEIIDAWRTAEKDEDGKPILAPSRWIEPLREVGFRVVIADEAHLLKSRRGARTQAVKALCDRRTGFRVALTGTPIWNRPADLWSLLDFVFPGRFGNYWQFCRRYADLANPPGWGWEALGVSHE